MTQDTLNMTSNGDVEIRKLLPGAIYKLTQLLESNEAWKQLMAVIPVGCEEGGAPKYTCEHMSMIEVAAKCQNKPCTEILLDEWGTSGRRRPTLSVLKRCLMQAELFRAADYVAEHLLNVPLPDRPDNGPAAPVELKNFIPSAPPPPKPSQLSLQPSSPTLPTMLLNPDMENEVVQLTYAELDYATTGFAETRILGGGSWGSVYLGYLPHLGAVAVKRLHIAGSPVSSDLLLHQFQNEVEVLAQVSHPNLLPLMGYSCDGHSPCLAYKFMKNGSLLDRLATKNLRHLLGWRTRVEIALGTAKGLAHLHNFLPKPLVHRDVKSANILLDDNFTAKLGDFGLVRIGASGTHTQSAAMTKSIIGTTAYMAPEAHRGDVSAKMDIFSFGVVLLELVTGLPPHDENREQGYDLVTYVGDVDDEEELWDKKIKDWPAEVTSGLFNLASSCLQDKRNRPVIHEVVEHLENLLL